MPEAAKAEVVVRISGALDELRDAVHRADFHEHLERGLVRAAMRRSRQAGDPAATKAKGFAPEEPASRTVEVKAFCS